MEIHVPPAGPTASTGASSTGTTVPARPAATAQAKRRLGGVGWSVAGNVVGSAVVGVVCSMLLFGRIAALSGLIGFWVVAYFFFLLTYVVILAQTEDRPAVTNAVMTVVLSTAAGTVMMALGSVIIFTALKGAKAVFWHRNFFTQDLHATGPQAPLTSGGITHAIVGTLFMITIALAITIPLGLTGAVYLNESKTRFAKLVRTLVDAMTALPSIVAGLFIYATWILLLHQQKSAFAASLAITVMMLPILIRAADVVLRLVPSSLREASAALGAPTWRTVWHVVLPTARSGLATAVILATARGVGETSPVLLTAGFTSFKNTDPFHGPMVSLPLLTFKLIASGQPGFIERGYASALFLLTMVITLFMIARKIGGRGPGHQSKRQRRRAARQSRADLERIESAPGHAPPARPTGVATP